ncbi:uncharacterized protein LOC113463761 isoform X2 [Phoenix dactylifera]|uniref:Uncharacterized protein LOC113463761 isoform X2 n=1 Tax=Phoenix dactylifera TaxID=42345 RepID=A0A8B8JDD7_PHODC|nr:uncharacterized protein LOC113463761 isoform X2 [Phoenix dactylifera]
MTMASEIRSTRSSARTQLDLLEQLTSSTSPGSSYESDGDTRKPTICEQLDELVGDREGDFSLPLGKRLQASRNSLTISQRRNIKRQAYLNEVARRNDSIFFATIGAFVILPPVVILSIAIFTGYSVAKMEAFCWWQESPDRKMSFWFLISFQLHPDKL